MNASLFCRFTALILLTCLPNHLSGQEPSNRREPVEFDRTPTVWSWELPKEVVDETAIFDASFSSDGQLVAIGDSLGRIMIRRLDNIEPLHTLNDEHNVPIRHVRFINNDRLLATLDLDGKLVIWNVDEGSKLTELTADGKLQALAVGKDTTQLVGLSDQPALCRWSVNPNSEIMAGESVPLDQPYRLLSASENSDVLMLAGDNDWQQRRWPSLDVHAKGSSNGPNISALRASPSGNRFALGRQDGEVLVYDVRSGKQEFRWRKHPTAVTCLTFSQSGSTLLSGCLRDRIRMWDLATGEHVNDRDVGLPLVTVLQLSKDDQKLCVAGMGHDINVFGVQVPSERFIPAIRRPKASNDKAVFAVRFLLGTDEIAVVPKFGTMERLDLDAMLVSRCTEIVPGNDRLKLAAISPDGMLTAHAYQSGNVRVIDSVQSKVVWEFKHPPSADAIAFSPDSKQLAIAGGHGSTIQLRNLDDGSLLWSDITAGQSLRGICFATDGQSVFTGGHKLDAENRHLGVLTHWSADNGNEISKAQSKDIYASVAISPHATRCVTGGVSGRICVFDQDLQRLRMFDVGGRGGIHRLKLIDERRLLVATYKGSLLMVDVETGQELARFEPLPENRQMPFRSIDYHPKNNLIVAAGGYDNRETMRVYYLDETVKK
ncbi:WD40 repeat domain-containing protein [Stieleria varia]|nr:WD40 repeat domain-containing protein [Stieleria varia]